MHSANDACLVLAENAAGTHRCVRRANECHGGAHRHEDSHFVHPCGFDEDGQYSTVTDLLRLAKAAHADPRIAHIVAQERAEISVRLRTQLSFRNTNQLLGHMGGVVGLKTGYTAQAGHCLIAVAEQSGHRVWLVLLDSQRRWSTANRIITDAFTMAPRVPHLHDAASIGG